MLYDSCEALRRSKCCIHVLFQESSLVLCPLVETMVRVRKGHVILLSETG